MFSITLISASHDSYLYFQSKAVTLPDDDTPPISVLHLASVKTYWPAKIFI